MNIGKNNSVIQKKKKKKKHKITVKLSVTESLGMYTRPLELIKQREFALRFVKSQNVLNGLPPLQFQITTTFTCAL